MEKLKQLSNLITRRDYSKIALPNNFEAPNLISLIKEAYDNFIYNDLSDLIKSFFPIAHEKNRKYELQFQNFKLLEPRFSEDEARRLGKTYESSIYVDINLVNLETGEVKQNKKGKKENISSGVYFGNIPLMTNHGTFVINGVEKFVMNQIVKSAGLYAFPNTQIKLLKKKKLINNICTEILPHRGTIMYFSVEKVGLDKAVFAYIRTLLGDNVAKLSVSVLLKAFGMSQNEILNVFSNDEIIKKSISLEAYNKEEVLNMPEVAEIYSSIEKSEGNEEKLLLGSPIDIKLKKLLLAYYKTSNKDLLEEIIIEVAAKFVVNEIKISTKMFESIYTSEKPICYQDIITRQFMDSRIYQLATAGRYKINHKARITERLFSNILAEDLVLTNGETLYKVGQIILNEELDNIKLALADGKLDLTKNVKFVKKTQLQSKISSTIEKIDIFGSSKMEKKITIISPTSDISHLALTMPDILSAVSYVLGLERKIGNYDDIEDLANKRIRLISEQLRNKLNLGMVKVEKFIKDKLASFSIVTANEEHQAKIDAKTTLHNVVNTGIFQLQIKNFFNTYDLTHFVDQVNPLSETTNKRRISSTGEGGVSVDDPNLSIRDIHSSHYGRICPTETPEGANVGLVLSMAMFAKLDEHGFLLSPFRKVLNGVATDEIE
jgi:DNA-directed RNA polymerase subunit beta